MLFTSQFDYLGDGNISGDAVHCQIPATAEAHQ